MMDVRAKIFHIVSNLFDVADFDTEDSRTKSRNNLIILTAAASAFGRIVSVGTALISLPITLHYLGITITYLLMHR